MNKEEIENFAYENKLDVQVIQPYHFRLKDTKGKSILDVYIKKTREGKIIKNTVLQWSKNKWTVAHNTDDLLRLIK